MKQNHINIWQYNITTWYDTIRFEIVGQIRQLRYVKWCDMIHWFDSDYGSILIHLIRWCDNIQPSWVFLPSLDHEFARQTNLEVCLQHIRDRGYACKSYLLDASSYGLPQSRRRVYIVCVKVSSPKLSVNAVDFFSSMKVILQATRFDPRDVDS